MSTSSASADPVARAGRRAGVIALGVVSVLLFSACAVVGEFIAAGDEEPDARLNSIHQMADMYDDDALVDFESDGGQCMREKLGRAGLWNVDVRSVGFTPQQHIEWFNIEVECFGDPRHNARYLNQVQAEMNLVIPGGQFEVEEISCWVGWIYDRSDDPARTLMMTETDDDVSLVLDAYDNCFTTESLNLLYGVEGAGPQDYGDDERLDGLFDDCGDGDLRACDLLYYRSSQGSAYEDFSVDCGGHEPESWAFCSGDIEVNDDWELDLDSIGTAALVTDCEGGDYTACDLLSVWAPLHSDLHDLGLTCDGRIPIGAMPDCRTRLG